MYPLLKGIRVLDLCKLVPGDDATRLLADLGADVIKVEEPTVGDWIRDLPEIYRALNRNKRSLTLNLKSDEGRRIFHELLETAQVVVEVSKPGTFQRIGMDYESLRARKPDLIYCSVTGYGQESPWTELPAHGLNINATAGLMDVDWSGEIPEMTAGSTAADCNRDGAVAAAFAILGALVQRSLTGKGQYIDVSCWDAGVSFGGLGARPFPPPVPRAPGQLGARYAAYRTKDGQALLLGLLERHFWEKFCRVVAREDLLDRRGDAALDFGRDDPGLREILQEIVETKTLAEWVDLAMQHDIVLSPILTPAQVFTTEQWEARDMVAHTEHPAYGSYDSLRPGFTIPEASFEVRYPPPMLGDHTAEILSELGYDDAAQQQLRAASAI
ncbi:MAG: CoA transferase [Acidobacteria bacterium]|nr:CoA transferase [Acidobacteriota bacterium]